MIPTCENSTYRLYLSDNMRVLKSLPDNSVDAVVTDPPYGLGKEPDALAMLRDWLETGHHDVKGRGFMGKEWDAFVPQPRQWREIYRVLKPGGHVLAFAGTRTQDLMALGLRLAGFEIRDLVAWVYGSGFPKSLDVSKAIDKRGGASVAWFGPWFRKWREENKITQKQVAALFPSKNGGLTGCVANWEIGLNLPTPEQFNLIRDRFGLPFDSVEEAEREVVGQKTSGIANKNEAKRHTVGAGSSVVVDITAPATKAARQWQGWGTALKPALEPITLARKPLEGTVAENVLKWHTGAVNVDGCRVGTGGGTTRSEQTPYAESGWRTGHKVETLNTGRWPANLIHDGSEEVTELFPNTSSGNPGTRRKAHETNSMSGRLSLTGEQETGYGDSGSAARFFYCAKASKRDRDEGVSTKAQPFVQFQTGNGASGRPSSLSEGRNTEYRNTHPTVKPTDLMRYLCRLITPPGGVVLDPWMGSGSTGKAAKLEGFEFIGMEMDSGYFEIAKARITSTSDRSAEENQMTLGL